MLRILLSGLLGSLVVGSLALAQENNGQPSATYEYNNSNIYYNSPAPQTQSQADQDFSIRTFTDPQTGDRVTQIRSRPQPVQQPAPLYIEPIIRPY